MQLVLVSDMRYRHLFVSNTPFTRYNRLSNRLLNRYDNRVERTATVRSTGCQAGLYNRLKSTEYTSTQTMLFLRFTKVLVFVFESRCGHDAAVISQTSLLFNTLSSMISAETVGLLLYNVKRRTVDVNCVT